jgi:hypothetical protein
LIVDNTGGLIISEQSALASPFATSEQAITFCNTLKDAGGPCIVQRN